MSLSRPTANGITKKLSYVAGACLVLVGLSATSALARTVQLQAAQQSPAPSCSTQAFSRPFTALGDSNNYTLVPGSEFASSSEGWELENGASVIQTTRPDGSRGGALDLPAGSFAVSPPVCVNLLYPTARIWERSTEGAAVTVEVAYAESKSAIKPKTVGHLAGTSTAWTLSQPFEVRPETTGSEEGNREVRFVFIANKHAVDTQLYGLYVDPRMR